MSDLETLFQFLKTILPAGTVAQVLTLVPVVMSMVGLARLVPWFESRKQWTAPALALLLGLAAGLVTVGFTITGAGAGLLVGIGAIGGFSTVKNVAAGVKNAA